MFIPQDHSLEEEYREGWKITDIFQVRGSGIKTDRDKLCFDNDKEELARRMQKLLSGDYNSDFIEKYNVKPSSSYDVGCRISRTPDLTIHAL